VASCHLPRVYTVQVGTVTVLAWVLFRAPGRLLGCWRTPAED
jgi:hypothetical protein